MLISEHFQYWNHNFQSNRFVSDIGITDVGYWILPTLRSMLIPTCEGLAECPTNPWVDGVLLIVTDHIQG
jgi:hypothetical protein